jgi:hypothetical protein
MSGVIVWNLHVHLYYVVVVRLGGVLQEGERRLQPARSILQDPEPLRAELRYGAVW